MMDRSTLRTALKERRAAIPQEEKTALDRAIVGHIAKSALFKRATAILLYAPIGSEINLLPLVRLAQKQGKKVAFPRCDKETKTMRFYELLPDAKLQSGAFGIPEPDADAPLFWSDEGTLCIVPALCCDANGNRIGYGGGYYDKFLKSFKGKTLCAVYRSFLTKTLPAEEWDVPVGYLATERGVSPTENNLSKATVLKRKAVKIGKRSLKVASSLAKKGAEQTKKGFLYAKHQLTREGEHKPMHRPALLVFSCFLLLLLSRLAEPSFGRDGRYVGTVVLQILVFLLPAVLYSKLRGGSFLERIRLRPPRPSQLWFIFCIFVVMISGGLLCEILTGGIESLSGSFTLYDFFTAQATSVPSTNIAVILAYALLPSFCEELVFRSILCSEYEERGVGVAMIASSLFFAMLHFSLPHFLTYFLLGMLLSGAFYATKSFLTVWILHFCYNLFCLFGQPYLSSFYLHAGSTEIFLLCLGVLFLLFAAFAAGEARKIYHLLAKANADSSYTVDLPIKKLPWVLWQTLRAPAAAACVILWLIVSAATLFEF